MEGISSGLSKPGAEPFEESSKAFPSIDTVAGTEQSPIGALVTGYSTEEESPTGRFQVQGEYFADPSSPEFIDGNFIVGD